MQILRAEEQLGSSSKASIEQIGSTLQRKTTTGQQLRRSSVAIFAARDSRSGSVAAGSVAANLDP